MSAKSLLPVGGVPLVRSGDGPTLGLFVCCVLVIAGALALPAPYVWVGLVLLVPALTLHSSLSHEILHGHPFRARWACTALGMIQPGLFIPYMRFKVLHLAHHRDEFLTDPYEDSESNYFDPEVWQVLPRWHQQLLMFNNTLLGRITAGPFLGIVSFVRSEISLARSGHREVVWHWLMHLPGVVLTLWVVSLSAMPLWMYLAACYGAMSVLKIRTFLEHRAHERASGRTVVIEDRGFLAFLFLYNNFHVVHHMHPGVAWYRLPALYREKKAHFLRRNDGYVYRSYGQIMGRYLVRRKDPVAHPLWTRKQP